MRIIRNKEIAFDKWKELLEISPYASPFQTPEFYELFNSVSGLSAEVAAIEESDSLSALAVITIQKEPGIKGFFSRRGIIYGGPLLTNNSPERFEILLTNISEALKKKCIYIEIRNYFDYSGFKKVALKCNYNYIPWLDIVIKTDDSQVIVSGISSSRSRQIKKAIKNGVKLKAAENWTEIRPFYNILNRLYKSKIGKPLLPVEFFTKFFSSKLGKYLLVFYNNMIIGGIMCMILENKAIYEFYVCGLDDEYKEQYPSVMATWAAIEYANQNNIPLFDFMGAGKPDEAYGVREFKARFGGEQVEYGRFLKINSPNLYKAGKLALKYRKIFQG